MINRRRGRWDSRGSEWHGKKENVNRIPVFQSGSSVVGAIASFPSWLRNDDSSEKRLA